MRLQAGIDASAEWQVIYHRHIFIGADHHFNLQRPGGGFRCNQTVILLKLALLRIEVIEVNVQYLR